MDDVVFFCTHNYLWVFYRRRNIRERGEMNLNFNEEEDERVMEMLGDVELVE